jgi:quercetin dioxygenase-like cupin family protein
MTRGSTLLSLAGLVAIGGVVLGIGIDRTVLAQQAPGIKRTVLQTTDEPGSTTHEAVMALAEVPPGGSSGRHRHPGVEIGYVIEGTVMMQHEGRPDRTMKAGDFFKNDGVHNVMNHGTSTAKILAVYMVEKGKPVTENIK